MNAHPMVALARAPLALLPSSAVLPILAGPLQGARWIVGAGNHVAWMGLYEYPKARLFARTIPPGATVYDLGAHAGFYTLLAARLVGAAGRVVAFEPLPRNVAYLHDHLRLNGAANVRVVEAAVSDAAGVGHFDDLHGSSYTGMLLADGGQAVRTVCLDDLVLGGSVPPPDFIKMDIEGGEVRALEGARATLARYRPSIFLAVHQGLHRECMDILWSLGYRVGDLRDWQPDELPCTDELFAQHPASPRYRPA